MAQAVAARVERDGRNDDHVDVALGDAVLPREREVLGGLGDVPLGEGEGGYLLLGSEGEHAHIRRRRPQHLAVFSFVVQAQEAAEPIG